MSDAVFIADRGAGKTWALCQWQRLDPEHRVIVVPNGPLRDWTARMLDPDTHPVRQRGVVSVSQVREDILRGRPRETVVVIDEWSLCNASGHEWMDMLRPFPVVAYTDTGRWAGGKAQAEFLEELGVST